MPSAPAEKQGLFYRHGAASVVEETQNNKPRNLAAGDFLETDST